MTPSNHCDLTAGAEALRPLFRRGGWPGGGGISYGWNADANGYGIWDHEREEWFPGQEFVADVRDIDGARFFAARVLAAAHIVLDEEERR